MTVKIGTAPVSWGVWFPKDDRQPPWTRFLDEAVTAGYDAIELGPLGYLPVDPDSLRHELSSRDLELTGAFLLGAFHDEDAQAHLQNECAELCSILESLGAEFLVLICDFHTDLFTGQPLRPASLTAGEWKTMIHAIHDVARMTSARGIKSVIHPHAETPLEYQDQVSQLMEDTDPDFVSLCLDIGHYAYLNDDVLSAIHNFGNRIKYIHLKNVDASVLATARTGDVTFAEAVARGVFADLDQGMVDYEEVRDALAGIRYEGWGIVEQDMYPVQFDRPLAIAKRNREFLREIGLG